MSHQYMYKGTIDAVDDDETTVMLVKKHPIGIIQLYVSTAIAALLGMGLIAILSFSGVDQSILLLIAVVGALLLIFLGVMLLIATFLYYESRMIITNKNITQILQAGLLSRKVSQLSLASVEDVTSNQTGLLATVFGYGTLMVETAGEQSNFVFTYCPDSGRVAKQILEARERFMEQDTAASNRATLRRRAPDSGAHAAHATHHATPHATAPTASAAPPAAPVATPYVPPQPPIAPNNPL